MPRQTLGIALFSYGGSVFWDIYADREAFPDLPRFVEDLEASFRALRRDADLELAKKTAGRAASSLTRVEAQNSQLWS